MAPARNPPWATDELLLALDLYVRHGQLDDTDERAVELSQVLNALPLRGEQEGSETYRNPNGVAMKLANFARLDPDYHGSGLTRRGRREEAVWERFHDDPDELHRVAEQLRAVAAGAAPPPPTTPEEGEDESEEGRILFRRHRVRERDRKLVRAKKQASIDAGGFRCEACEMDPLERYGPSGAAVIECHHVLPLAQSGPRTTRLKDLALVCRNCHAAIHAGGGVRTIAEVRDAMPGQ